MWDFYKYFLDNRFSKYFEFVNKWEFEVAVNYKSDTLQEWIAQLTFPFFAIATNKSQRIIAGSLRVKPLLQSQLQNGVIHLLPPPKTGSLFQAVETIIDLILGEVQSKVAQPWRKSVEIPNEKEIGNSIQTKLNEMQKIGDDIKILQQQIQRWNSYRDLLSGTGEELELIVQKTLSDIGINTTKTEKGFCADLVNNEVAIEVTGIKGGIGLDSNKVIQTNVFIQNFRKDNEKVILIVNTYRDIAPKDRKGKMNFSPEIENYLKSLSISYMTTNSLYELWKDIILGKKKAEQVKEKILATIGEVTP